MASNVIIPGKSSNEPIEYSLWRQQAGYGLEFDGDNDVVAVPDFNQLTGTVPFTCQIKFETSTDHESTNERVIGWGDSSVNGGKFHLRLNQNSSNGVVNAIRVEWQGGNWVGSKVINDGLIHTIQVIKPEGDDGSELIVLVDGEVESSSGGNFGEIIDIIPSTYLHIGNAEQGGDVTDPFTGAVSQLVMWDYEQTVEEAKDNVDKSFNGEEDGLVYYCNFEDRNPDQVTDISGNDNYGVIEGATPVEIDNVSGLIFDGQNDYVDFGNSDFAFQYDDDFSFEIHIKPASIPDAFQWFIGRQEINSDTNGVNGWSLQNSSNRKKLRFTLVCTPVAGENEGIVVDTEEEVLFDSLIKVKVSYDGSEDASGVTIEVNDEEVSTVVDRNNVGTVIDYSGFNATIGARSTGEGFLKGTVSNNSLISSAGSVISKWNFNDYQDNVIDLEGNNDGTINGATYNYAHIEGEVLARPWQLDNEFLNLQPGDYIVKLRDGFDCTTEGKFTIKSDSYETDFSKYEIGTFPSDWSPSWEADLDNDAEMHIEITDESSLIGGKSLGFKHDDLTIRWPAILWNEPGNVNDVTLETLFWGSTNFIENGGVVARVNGNSGYVCRAIYNSTDQLRIIKYVDGSPTTIGSYNFDYEGRNWYRIKFQVIGNELKAKTWHNNSDEPDNWQIEITDDTFSNEGKVGVTQLIATESAYGDWRKIDYLNVKMH